MSSIRSYSWRVTYSDGSTKLFSRLVNTPCLPHLDDVQAFFDEGRDKDPKIHGVIAVKVELVKAEQKAQPVTA